MLATDLANRRWQREGDSPRSLKEKAMRFFILVVLGVGMAALSPGAFAQRERDAGLSGAIDSLHGPLRRDRPGDDGSSDSTGRDDESRGVLSGSSLPDDGRAAESYRRFSDQDLRTEAARLQREQRRIEREQSAVRDEMQRRGGR
jgi:hypothetical protein